jgi:bifunctional oligoribonuclease and PAP phosphatase NrnA
MSEAGYAAVVERLRQDRKICVTTHESPDGDALGSLLGAGLALRAAGYDVAFYLSGTDEYPAEYRFLPVEEIEREPPADAADRVLYAFDCGSARRIGPDETLLQRFPLVVNVDHHHDNTRFGDVNLVDAQAACTAQIIARLLDALGIEVPPAAAEALYVGLVTDTGRFQYANTTPDAFRLAAELVEEGVQPARVFGEIWESVPFAKQRLLGTALSRARLECDGRLLVAWLDRKDFDQAGAPDAFSEGLIDQLRAVQGVDVAALIREPAGNGAPRHKISLRSRTGGVDVSSIARRQGGGGHKEAAGFSSEASVDEIVDFLRGALDGGSAG